MKFSFVADYFQKIEQESSRTGMTQLLAELFKQANAQEIAIIANLSLGQMHPPYLNATFNLAEKNVIKALSVVMHKPLAEIESDAKKLGDLGLVVQEASWLHEQELSVVEVYQKLLAIEQISGTGAQEEKINQLSDLLKNLDHVSAKFIVRIILGKLRMGFSDMTIIDALSWMAIGNKSLKTTIESAYNLCVDIGFIAAQLKEHGIEALEKMQVQIGIPIRPSAAERLPTARAIFEKLGTCVAQPKLDGFRLQIHLKKNERPQIHFFSRNLIDMSYMFPDLADQVAHINVETMICEGEAIVYDTHTGTFLPFQETVKRKRKHGIEQAMEEFPLRLYLFDILYLNGEQLLDKTHEERRTLLLSLVKNGKNDTIQVIGEKAITTVKELEDYFAANISAGLEGLVVKRPDAIYQPGKRNFNWIKLKRQEEGHLEDTVDCVILGYYFGEGKRVSFGVGAFLVGVYNPEQDRYETVAKIGTGMTDEQWKELKVKCDAIKVPDVPKNAYVAKELAPDVWVDPSIVCIIRADEITVSPLHTAGKTEEKLGYALRFPRFMGYSIDKSAHEATTIEEIKHLYNDQFIA